MNITFLIGNGFDLNLGLKTSYRDFLEKYCENNLNDEDDEIVKFKSYMDGHKEEVYWADAELAFLKYSTKFNGNDRTLEDYRQCHLNIGKELGKYLEQEEVRNWLGKDGAEKDFAKAIHFEEFVEKLPPVIKKELKSYASHINGGYIYNFLSFNYTRMIDLFVESARDALGKRQINAYLSEQNRIGELIHVHGYTDKFMVFGGSDESQIANINLFEGNKMYLKQFIKAETNEIYQNGTDELAYSILKTSDIIYIFGMSLGATDSNWWKRICKLLCEKQNLRVIIYSHKKLDDNPVSVEWWYYTERLKDSFVEYSDLSTDMLEKIKRKIYITNVNLFKDLQGLGFNRLKQSANTDVTLNDVNYEPIMNNKVTMVSK